MAQKLDYARPYNNLTQYVPQKLRNMVNFGLFDNLFNRFMTRDESVPFYGYVGRKPSNPEDKSPAIYQPTVERDVNAVIPVLNFKQGSETVAFTVQDLLNKAKVLGMDTNDLSWLYAQANNFRPPIDFDKFTNFFNYYWIGASLQPDTAWNPTWQPEYYIIAKPQASDLDKMNVMAATISGQNIVLTGTGFLDQTFTITFTDALNFTVTSSVESGNTQPGPSGTYTPLTHNFALPAQPGTVSAIDLVDTFEYKVTGFDGVKTLVTFKITRSPAYNEFNAQTGWTACVAGDKFTVATTMMSSNYNVTFIGSAGVKPSISGVTTLKTFQNIDGYIPEVGDRVLIKNQSNGAENGIYVVGRQAWARAEDFNSSTWSGGAKTFDRHRSVLWVSTQTGPTTFSWTSTAGDSNTNDWQEGNFWIKGEELINYNLDRASVQQAVRPIIEYASNLQLNSHVSNVGAPAETGFYFKQVKTEFNQLPLFDLFRYDGTHAGIVSSIFYYVEDLTANLDVALQKRVKISTNDSADFVFNHGCADAAGNLLFFKRDGSLHTVWHAGYLGPEVIDTMLVGTGNGTITALTAADNTQQQVWTVTADTASTFTVTGSKLATLPSAASHSVAGAPYDNGEIGFTITSGSTPFSVGDTFVIRVGNMERPRYVFRAADTSIQDLYGGAVADTANVGAHLVSRTFYNNPYNDSRAEILEGSLYTHFRSVLANEIAGLPLDYAFGGNIKLWSEQHTLLASLLMQKDLTPISLIDMAKRQYDNGLNSLRDLYITHIVDYFSTTQVVSYDGSPDQSAKTAALLDALLALRAKDNDSRLVLFDTTAACVGFPITLPQLGLAPLVEPAVRFDRILNQDVLVHHDGHLSSLVAETNDFRGRILGGYVGKPVKRSDGTSTPAIGSSTWIPPINPYKGELWLRPSETALPDLLAFDVTYDTVATPPATPAGLLWYNRTTGILSQSTGSTWVALPSKDIAWKTVNLADTLNEIIYQTEHRLYHGINPNQRRFDFADPVLSADPVFKSELQRELFTFASLNNLDPLGTNYTAADAFTWNYAQATFFAPVNTATIPGRWYKALMAHQATIAGVIPTERPDMEPWKLFGFSTYAAWKASPQWFASYEAAVSAESLYDPTYVDSGSVKVVAVDSIGSLAGLQVVDGISLQSGDRVLVQNEAVSANNGIYLASTGAWTRTTALVQKMFVRVLGGARYSDTLWYLSAAVPSVGVSPVLFQQVRQWSTTMWTSLMLSKPALKLSVNPWSDLLLPPYVASSALTSSFALTNVIPTGVALPYDFGGGSPVEEVWERSIEYRYALVKALLRFDPLAALGFAWGFNWVEVDNILYDGYDINLPGHKRFRLHGDAVTMVDRTGALTIGTISGPAAIDIMLTYDAYTATRAQSFGVRTVDGTLLGSIQEGGAWNFNSSIVNITNIRIEDFGQPFHIGDSFHITATTAGSDLVVTFVPAPTHRILGLGQTFTNALREMSVDSKSSYANAAFRDWDVNMGYRAGSLVVTDDLNVFNENETLNPSSYNLILKKNAIAADHWIQALRVTVFQTGNFALNESTKVGDAYRGSISNRPKDDASDWVFRIEGYNPRYNDISYYGLQNIASGMAFPGAAPIGQRFFRHDTGELYTFSGTSWDVTSSSDLMTFNVLDQSNTTLTWYQSTVRTGVITTGLPITITGVQNLLNFLFGYAQYLEDAGWRFNTNNEFNIDALTGRRRNFQLEIEKAVHSIFGGISVGLGAIINPFIDRVWFEQKAGMMSEFTDTAIFDITGDTGVFDILGMRFRTADLRPVRGNATSSIASIGPMYSAHIQLDEFEHLFVFNDYVNESTQSGLLYDAFSGSRAVTYKFNGRKQGNTNLRLEFGGHYIVGHEVRQNLQLSTDNLARVYDADYAFENTTTSKHALALLGFSTKDYFNNLDITDKTQFNFWRGLIHSKGTNMSIDAYLNSNRFQEAKIDEYWAYKIAEYGDSRQNSYPEMRLQVSDTLQQFTQLQFDAAPATELNNFTQINRFMEDRWFSIDDLDQDAYFKAEQVGQLTYTATTTELITLPFIADKLVITGPATQVNATSLSITAPGTITVTGYGPATPRYNPVKLFNYVAEELVEEIPMWHPAVGQHTPTALEAINVIGPLDPARYNYSTLVADNNSYDPLRAWGDKELGRVWFDTRKLDYIPYYDTTIFTSRAERLSRWGARADYATIDIYEWVKSSVPPSEYAALAKVEALDADIAAANKASGEVALQETYSRDRIWSVRPIAWSQSGTVTGGHPAFGESYSSTNTRLYIGPGNTYSIAVADGAGQTGLGTFSGQGITVGMHIGAWDPDTNGQRAISEAVITGFTKRILYDGDLSGVVPSSIITSTVPGICSVTLNEYTQQYGQLIFVPEPVSASAIVDANGAPVGYTFNIALRVTDFNTGVSEVLELSNEFATIVTPGVIPNLPNMELVAGQQYTFTAFGLKIVFTVGTTGTYSPVTVGVNTYSPVQYALWHALSTHIEVWDSCIVEHIVEKTIPGIRYLTNNVDDLGFAAAGYNGWAAWTVPTQAQLDADGKQPKSVWKPYPGLWTQFWPDDVQLAAAVAYEAAPLTLNDGTTISRYSTTWTDWVVLTDIKPTDKLDTKVQTATGNVVFTYDDNVDSTRTTIYINGIAQLKSAYNIVGTEITVYSVLRGHVVTVVVRKYSPTADELSFDPTVKDDLTFQQQFKVDYEYVSVPVRDSEGSLATTNYYFWVKNRTVPAGGKKLSTSSIAQSLKDGPPSYLTFQTLDAGMIGSGSTSDPYRYDAITLSGLSYLVTKNDTFKLRFTRNFTLRDDPLELDLKNTHTEWGLIRSGQKARVPEFLWTKLTDSMAGQDAAGNTVPSLRRALYDERTGSFTSFGFGPEQTLAPADLLRLSVAHTILNTRLTVTSNSAVVPDFISFLDTSYGSTEEAALAWFPNAPAVRNIMAQIWNQAKTSQVNELFFAALEDVLASNLEMTDIFKTSRLSAYSIRTVTETASVPTYE
jgi:hypothetical protein